MKFNFKIQQYQTDAVENTVKVFAGQPSYNLFSYRRDLGKRKEELFDDETGYRNNDIKLKSSELLDNIQNIQAVSDITPSTFLAEGLGAVNLDIEMETGTGKTYVYIKTMFELNKRYGWSKFIVVVPSIAIREGVAKSFSMLEEHFMEYYGKKARFFVYNSANLNQLDNFSSSSGINVMIINTQAFAASMKEGGRSKESRVIYDRRDEFRSRRPIDVLAANRPIIIMDEPQKMEGKATQEGLKKFNPLFVLNYSATHKTKHNTIYALDALDAYKQKLVKKIHVKGFEVRNLTGTNAYMYIDNIVLSPNHPPRVRIELEMKNKEGNIRRKSSLFDVKDSLYSKTDLHQYDGFVISEINPFSNTVSFLNGITISKGQVIGDSSERAMQEVQIRETIASHFDKEQELFSHGIKTLSLFFIDEVANYKSYDKNGEEVKGVFQDIFEREYTKYMNEHLDLFDEEYRKYLLCFNASQVHNGYFSIDKKSGHVINSSCGRKSDISDDISAYELILKNKERLLSFDEPTRFIFSHSALREGWDNPNVFQICTLRHSNSSTAKRQEVGRGLRICVDKNGNRMDKETLGDDVYLINRLTVIANESYADFTKGLQDETREILRERATKATTEYFKGKYVSTKAGNYLITDSDASRIIVYLEDNDYIDGYGNITSKYREAVLNNEVEPLPVQLSDIEAGIRKLINSIFDPNELDDMVVDDNKAKTAENKLNGNFAKKEFQALWNEINHKYVYTVYYDSNELIQKSIDSINANLSVKELIYVMREGSQQDVATFGEEHSKTSELRTVSTSTVTYDLVGEIAKGATLTRRSIVNILKGIKPDKLSMFKRNPEEFIQGVIKLIKEQKATMIVDHINYNRIEGKYDSSIFTANKRTDFDKAYPAKKHITDYVFTDGFSENSIERRFANEMDIADEVVVYAKLPRTFHIPTPVGNYAPDWAIAFKAGTVRHIFFIAETKGSMEDMQFRKIETSKTECAEKLFNHISTSNVRYAAVDSYTHLLDIIKTLE